MSGLIITSGCVFNVNDIVMLTKTVLYLKWPETKIVVNPGATTGYTNPRVDTYGIKEYSINKGDYDIIVEKILKIQEESNYKSRYEELKTHLAVMPGGTEYLIAKQDFEEKT